MRIAAGEVLTGDGWRRDVTLRIEGGRIAAIDDGADGADVAVDVLVPAPANLHSHAFQRALAGLTERAGHGPDDFWTWRDLMYRFLERLTPDDVEALAVGVMMETLESGFAAIGEFHYVHNAPDGTPYDDPAELSVRIVAAAEATGIGLTLLPVLYRTGGLDGRPLAGGQRRFGASLEGFAAIHEGAARALAALPADARIGVAPHSLRAVPAGDFASLAAFPGPRHIHIAEQVREVEEVRSATGRPPVARLLDLVELDPRWTLIHATHAGEDELRRVAGAGACVGLCPITEANLGDGIFPAGVFLRAGGAIGVGSDSNVRISLAEELRLLDYGQRLALRRRNPLASPGGSSGRALLEAAARGGAASLDRDAGGIAVGRLADLAALDGASTALAGLSGDALLDAWLFAGDSSLVTHVWSAGRHVVRDGRHIARDTLAPRFEACLRRLRAAA